MNNPLDPAMAAALRRLNRLAPESLPELATAWLQQGLDGPAVRELAGHDGSSWREAYDVFERAMTELQVAPLTGVAAGGLVARRHARLLLDGQVTPYEAAREIARLSVELNHPAELEPFWRTASEWEDYHHVRSDSPETYDALIAECDNRTVQLARTLLQHPPPNEVT